MTEFVWPNGVRMSSIGWRHISNSEAATSEFSGSTQTASRPGDRLGWTVRVNNAMGVELALLRSLAARMRGKANRIYLQDLSITGRRRGSFPATELFANADFASGTAGWTFSPDLMTVSDGVARIIALTYGANPEFYQVIGLTAYAPYVLRSVIVDGAQSAGLAIGQSLSLGATTAVANYTTSRGYSMVSGVAHDATARGQFPVVFGSLSGYTAGAFASVPFNSLSRCFLVDGGGNLWPRSDEFGNAAWSKTGCTILSDVFIGADGTTTMDALQEDGTTGNHYVSQGVSVLTGEGDFMLSCVVAANFRSFCWLQMTEATGGTSAFQYFNLTAGGSVGVNGSTGAGWSNRRAFTRNLGNNRVLCILIARKTSAATGLIGYIGAAAVDGSSSYTGNNGVGGAAVGIWRATLWPTSVPSRSMQSTSAAVAATTQQGRNLYVKGLPASTTGLLKQGDQIEADKQIKVVQADLDGDATGCGYLQLDSPFARELPDYTPIIVHQPMAKFYMASDNEYEVEPGVKSNFQFDFVQDLSL